MLPCSYNKKTFCAVSNTCITNFTAKNCVLWMVSIVHDVVKRSENSAENAMFNRDLNPPAGSKVVAGPPPFYTVRSRNDSTRHTLLFTLNVLV